MNTSSVYPDFELAVVGGGLTAARALRSYRDSGGEGRAALFTLDAVLPYHRPPLSKRYLRGEQELDAAFVEPASFYAERDVDVFLETGVTSVDPVRRTLTLPDGARVRFGKLLLATGAEPRRPTAPGAELAGVHTLRTAGDAASIREAARAGGPAVVLGTGFVGMEVAASLRALGVHVALVNRTSGAFEALRAPALSSELLELYAANGVELVLPGEVARFRGRRRVEAVELTDGRSLDASLVVAGFGVEPATRFLADSGLELDNGIVVDERFETRFPDIHAAGDVARFWDPLFARLRRIEHWSNANYQGTRAGAVLAGAPGGYDTVSSFFTEVFGVTVKVFGEAAGDRLVVDGSLEEGLLGLYFEGRQLVGALTVGQDEATETRLKDAIRARAGFAAPDDALERLAA